MLGNYTQCVPILQNSTYIQAGVVGILNNLLINLSISAVILIIFFFLKAISWSNQHDVFELYKDGWICILYRDVFDLVPPFELYQMRCTHRPLDRNMSYRQMIWHCLIGSKLQEISERCGVDAVQYLKFLRCVIQYNIINTVVVLFAIVPANLQGDVRKNEDFFVQTMMDNVDCRHEWVFWIHICVQTFLMILGFYLIRVFSTGLYSSKRSKWAKKTVVVKDLSFKVLTSKRIEHFFKKVLPQEKIEDIRLVYKYRTLVKYNRQLEDYEESLILCQHILAKEERRVYVKNCCWCCHFYCNLPCERHMIDAIEYYSREIEHMKKLIATELSLLPMKIFKIAYVTFQYEYSAYQALKLKKKHTISTEDNFWQIREAEEPRNILWASLTRRGSNYTLKTLLINTAVLIIAIFVTTPAIILTGANISVFKQEIRKRGAVFRYFPILLTWLLSVVLPVLVTYSSGFLDFETKSGRNKSIMVKTVIFLVFVVVILPTLGITSISAFILWTLRKQDKTAFVWSCLFFPENGYFFVSYVMTAALVGNLIQLLRLPEVCFCIFYLLIAKSEVEKMIIRRYCIWDFMYGVQYAYGLLIFFLIMFYSLMIPMMAPAGLLYFLIKYVVDRHNICYSCLPSQASTKMHSLAIQFMLFALVLKPTGLLFFIISKKDCSLLLYTSTTILVISILLWIISMNPLNLKFIPELFLLPHRVSPQTPPYYYEEDAMHEKEVYQPYDYRKYAVCISPVDKYGNILFTNADEEAEDEK